MVPRGGSAAFIESMFAPSSPTSSDDAHHKEIMDETWHGSKPWSILFLGKRGGGDRRRGERGERRRGLSLRKARIVTIFPRGKVSRRDNVEQDFEVQRRQVWNGDLGDLL